MAPLHAALSPTLDDLFRFRDAFRELSWHGDSVRLLERTGVDEGELAWASEVVAEMLDARILAERGARERPR